MYYIGFIGNIGAISGLKQASCLQSTILMGLKYWYTIYKIISNLRLLILIYPSTSAALKTSLDTLVFSLKDWTLKPGIIFCFLFFEGGGIKAKHLFFEMWKWAALAWMVEAFFGGIWLKPKLSLIWEQKFAGTSPAATIWQIFS